MYWLRWHYHVKDIAGAPSKIKKKSKQKRQNRRQSVVVGRQQLYCAVQSRSPDHGKTRPEKYSLQLTTERRQWRCIPDRRRQAVPRTCWSHWEGTVTKCWTSGGWYHQHGWVSRAQTTTNVDVSCPVKTLSKVRRRCSMKTAVGQNAQPECDLPGNSQPIEFTKQWGYAFWLPCWENQTGGSIQDRLQPVLQLARDTSEDWVAVVHLTDNQCMNQGQQGMPYRDRRMLRI